MSDLPDPPRGWTVWNADPDGRIVLAFRPDVFNTTDHPPECLPTIYIAQGRRNHRRPGVDRPEAASGDWFVRLYFEPSVELQETMRYPDRPTAVDGAYDLASDFANGDVDPRDVYQVPRPEYFDALDELTGTEPATDDASTDDS
jgi:hypothetical protein